ncbi:UNVERIFIED_CONTAM: hypothetical protein Slati_1993800 [Sesamum latifolium]|uniref:Uncharacterized protein n=1 Tax=Sesamum latifolium TaxID=2727402 RepID=A0AAW2WPM7_9LAMI
MYEWSMDELKFHGGPCIGPSLSIIASSHNQPPSPPTSEQAILEAIADSDATQSSLPAVRTFENDLTRLSLVGAVDFQQALTAAAADGGEAADEHLSSGIAAMVVETIFPGPSNDHSTVSTRLFLPARKVKEKAIKLKKSLRKEMLHGATSKNILAMTFRQVVMQHLWSLELALFRPGTERDMDNLENPRDVVLSTDGNIIGFQPTNRIAVNNWAANPLAKELLGRTWAEDKPPEWSGSVGAVDVIESQFQFCIG